MLTPFGKMFILFVLVLSCLAFTGARAQTQVAQYYPPNQPYPPGQYAPPTPEERERMHEEREHERHERREWREEEWRRHEQRYFGGVVITPFPGEAPEAFRNRVLAQCNVNWNQCVTRCNTMPNPYHRAACINNCNNELYECRAF